MAESREQAQRLILAGQVRVSGDVVTKPAHPVADGAVLEIEALPRFVSRGGDKLEAALKHFGVRVAGKTCLDVGASTGGFTDCLLQHGAVKVFAVDVGRGQLHWKLRNDARVVCMEGINARRLSRVAIPVACDVAVVDVSFISLTKVLPAVIRLIVPGADVVTLIKPQFEAGRSQVGRGGVVRDDAVRAAVVEQIRRFGEVQLGMKWHGVHESPLRGPAGNVEYLAHWTTAVVVNER